MAVSLAMMFFFHEKKSLLVMLAVLMSLFGAALLSSGELEAKSGDTIVGLVAACISVFSYGGYIIGVRTTRAAQINSTVLTLKQQASPKEISFHERKTSLPMIQPTDT